MGVVDNISTELTNIRDATYGEQVRGSIHDGIKKIAQEVDATVAEIDSSNPVIVRKAIAPYYDSNDQSVVYNVGDYVYHLDNPPTDAPSLYRCQTPTTGGVDFPGSPPNWVKATLGNDINRSENNQYRFDSASGPGILAGKSCDDLTRPGVWYVNKVDGVSTLTDFPIDGPGWIRISGPNTGRLMQEVYPSDIETYSYRLFRTKDARIVDGVSTTAWTDWYKVPLIPEDGHWGDSSMSVIGTGLNFDTDGAMDIALQIAEPFTDNVSYAIGDLVVKDNVLYKFTSNHAAGIWTGNDVINTIVTHEVKTNEHAIHELHNLTSYLDFNSIKKDTIIIDNIEDGYYSSANGSKQNNDGSSTYVRSPYLIKAEEKTLYVSKYGYAFIACYDGNMDYIGRVLVKYRNSKSVVSLTPVGTEYIGVYAENAEKFEITKVNSSEVQCAEYPYTSDDYLLLSGCWMNGNGTVASADTFNLLVFSNVIPGDKYYVSNNATYNCLCFDIAGNMLTVPVETRNVLGKVFTVPENAVVMYINLYTQRTKGTSSEPMDYICKLNGKKVLAIGDSITWLDGRQNYGGAEYMSGWQRQLRLKGYDVFNAGFSGYPYATGLDIVEGVDYSIYKEIVTDNYDVTGYDYVVLFGGTNDVLYGGDLGSRISDYSNRSFDASKFNGALSAIISYIRTNNATAKILLASFPKSEAASRIYTNAISRVAEIEYNADFWSCKYVDIFRDMNVSPTYDGFDEYFYDSTHPNFDGMQLIGSLMLKAIESYE